MGRFLGALFEFVVVVIVAKLLGRVWQLLFGPRQARFSARTGGPGTRQKAEAYDGKTVRDPVCGMFVSTELSQRLEEGGETLHFCSRECLERYQKDPAHVQN